MTSRRRRWWSVVERGGGKRWWRRPGAAWSDAPALGLIGMMTARIRIRVSGCWVG
jgi:hypothetical protein